MSKKASAKMGNKAIESMFGKGSCKGRPRTKNYKGADIGAAKRSPKYPA